MEALPLLVAEVLVIAAGVTWFLVSLINRLAWRFDVVARPDGVRRVHERTTPLWGGVGLFLGIAVAILAACRLHSAGWAHALGHFGLAAGMLWLVGIRDDVRPLSARVKLACQIGIALLIVLSGCYPKGLLLLDQYLYVGWIGAIFMMAWLVLGINAMNLIDGMDGLASVIGILTSTAIAIVAGIQGNLPALVLAVAMAGGLAGFLVHNRPPATIFLGDAGSTVIGLVLSFLAFQIAVDATSTVHVTTLAMLLFVPLLDTHLAITRRLLAGTGIFHGDRSHLHHQLLDRGLGVWKTLGLLGAFSGVCVVAGCLAAITGAELAAWVAVLGTTITLVAGGYVGRQELALAWRALSGATQGQSEPGLPSDALSDLPHIIPMNRGLSGGLSPSRRASSSPEAAKSPDERRVA